MSQQVEEIIITPLERYDAEEQKIKTQWSVSSKVRIEEPQTHTWTHIHQTRGALTEHEAGTVVQKLLREHETPPTPTWIAAQ